MVGYGSSRLRKRITSIRCGNLYFWLLSVNILKVDIVFLGEQFEEPRVIGLGLSLRTKERLLEIWLKDGRNEKVRANVSNKLRQVLNLDPDNVTLYYKEH
jgi:hypothetical protein